MMTLVVIVHTQAFLVFRPVQHHPCRIVSGRNDSSPSKSEYL